MKYTHIYLVRLGHCWPMKGGILTEVLLLLTYVYRMYNLHHFTELYRALGNHITHIHYAFKKVRQDVDTEKALW